MLVRVHCAFWFNKSFSCADDLAVEGARKKGGGTTQRQFSAHIGLQGRAADGHYIRAQKCSRRKKM